jgi:hypothetical protein
MVLFEFDSASYTQLQGYLNLLQLVATLSMFSYNLH